MMASGGSLEPIGQVVAFYVRAESAAVKLMGLLRVGDRIYVRGHTTDFQQLVESLQLEHHAVGLATEGQIVGIKTIARCRKHDFVYKITEPP